MKKRRVFITEVAERKNKGTESLFPSSNRTLKVPVPVPTNLLFLNTGKMVCTT